MNDEIFKMVDEINEIKNAAIITRDEFQIMVDDLFIYNRSHLVGATDLVATYYNLIVIYRELKLILDICDFESGNISKARVVEREIKVLLDNYRYCLKTGKIIKSE